MSNLTANKILTVCFISVIFGCIFGFYIILFQVMKSFILFLTWYSFFIIAFGLGFYIMLHKVSNSVRFGLLLYQQKLLNILCLSGQRRKHMGPCLKIFKILKTNEHLKLFLSVSADIINLNIVRIYPTIPLEKMITNFSTLLGYLW